MAYGIFVAGEARRRCYRRPRTTILTLRKRRMKSGRLAVFAASLLADRRIRPTRPRRPSAAPRLSRWPASWHPIRPSLSPVDQKKIVAAFLAGERPAGALDQDNHRHRRQDRLPHQQCRHRRALLRTDVRQPRRKWRARGQRTLCHGRNGRRALRRRRRLDHRTSLQAELHARSQGDQAKGRQRRELHVRPGESTFPPRSPRRD